MKQVRVRSHRGWRVSVETGELRRESGGQKCFHALISKLMKKYNFWWEGQQTEIYPTQKQFHKPFGYRFVKGVCMVGT